MKCLVTGCAGFIGSHLTESLLEKGGKVIGVDCFTNYYERSVKERNMGSFSDNENFTFLEKNVNELLESEIGGVDVVFHLAAQAGVQQSWGSFEKYVENNILSTQHLLELSKNSGVKTFVFASSSSVYGDSEIMSENLVPQPISPYGVSKITGEQLCKLYARDFNLQTVILRYFNVYGPRQRPDMAFFRFIDAALNGGTITIYGDGNQIRDFTYVGDVVEATIKSSSIDSPNEVINVGGGSPVKLNDTVNIIKKVLGDIMIVHEDAKKGDAKITKADNSKLQELLDINFTPIEEGLKKQIEWQKSLK